MMRPLCLSLLAASILAPSASAQTSTATFDAAKAFGARENVLDIGISPDGKQLALVIPRPNGGEAVTVLSADGSSPPRLALTSKGISEQITGCDWVSNSRLLCKLWFVDGKSKDISAFTRNVAINVDGTQAKVIVISQGMTAMYRSTYGGNIIDYNGGTDGSILMIKQFVPEMTTGTIIRVDREGVGVVRVDTLTGKEAIVEQPKMTVGAFVSDGRGAVRIIGLRETDGTGYAGDTMTYRYRKPGTDNWIDLSKVVQNPSGTASGFSPVAVDPTSNVAYGFQDHNGYSALYKVPLDGSGTAPALVISKPGIDVDSLMTVGRSKRVVGVSYATDYRTADYFDPELARLATAFHKALPGKSQIDFIDASQDETKLVLRVGSDTDPGKYYLFDKSTKKLAEILELRPLLNTIPLSAMKPIRFPAADGTMIPAYVTLPLNSAGKNLPTIIMPHGGPEARDEWGFDWLVQFYAARGYAVIQPQYRGSTGFGSAFFGSNGFQAWRRAISDIDDAARWAVKDGLANADKLAIVGWSYGGYAALQSQVVDPGLYKAVVAVAPVTDFDQLRSESYNQSSFKQLSARIGTGPHVAEGSPARHATAFQAPVLLFHGDRDMNVDVSESRLMERRLKDAGKSVEYVEFTGLDHYLDDSAARTRLLSQSDAFLRKAMGLPAN